MSYPYDAPSPSMTGIWTQGAYTPDNTVAYIRDNVTPINKTTMRNSVGYQISLLQNYINSYYLGRPELPVKSGYIIDANIDNILSSGIWILGPNYINISPYGVDVSNALYGTHSKTNINAGYISNQYRSGGSEILIYDASIGSNSINAYVGLRSLITGEGVSIRHNQMITYENNLDRQYPISGYFHFICSGVEMNSSGIATKELATRNATYEPFLKTRCFGGSGLIPSGTASSTVQPFGSWIIDDYTPKIYGIDLVLFRGDPGVTKYCGLPSGVFYEIRGDSYDSLTISNIPSDYNFGGYVYYRCMVHYQG